MWMFALIQGEPGKPSIDKVINPYLGHIYIGSNAGWGGYLISGTTGQINSLHSSPSVILICDMTVNVHKWNELNNSINPAVRNKLNIWLTDRGLTNISAGTTNRQVVEYILKALNDGFDISNEWVTD